MKLAKFGKIKSMQLKDWKHRVVVNVSPMMLIEVFATLKPTEDFFDNFKKFKSRFSSIL